MAAAAARRPARARSSRSRATSATRPALTAGLEHARGDVVVMLDGDLQDPPEVIPEMLARWREGSDVVYAVRQQRPGETPVQAASPRAGSTASSAASPTSTCAVDSGDFRLMDRARARRAARDARAQPLPARDDASGSASRRPRCRSRARRAAPGVTKYPLRKMLRFSLRRDHELLQPRRCSSRRSSASSARCSRSSRSR